MNDMKRLLRYAGPYRRDMVLGAVLVVWPDRSVRLMCTLLGAALLICGLVYILGWLVRRREGGISAFTLAWCSPAWGSG